MPHVVVDSYHELYFTVVYEVNLWVNILNIRKCMVGVTRYIARPFNPLKMLGFKPQLLPRTEGFYIYNILKYIHACIMH
jgi:hypothetical protein